MEQKYITKNHQLIVGDDYEEMSEFSANLIYEELRRNVNLLMCTATGSTPTLTYDKLATKCNDALQSFDSFKVVKLDEWGGLPMDDPATCETYLQEHLIKPIDIKEDNRYIAFNSDPEDPQKEIARVYEEFNKIGNIDLCILGMGVNGHLGFNEPADQLHPEAHVAELKETTKQHTMAQKAEHEIKYGLTLGIRDIMLSKHIVLLVNGKHKVEPFKKFMSQKIDTQFPATMLWMHDHVTIICDKEVVSDINSI